MVTFHFIYAILDWLVLDKGESADQTGAYHYEYETATDLTLVRFSLDRTFGEILEQPLAVELFNQLVPGMVDNPMIDMAYPRISYRSSPRSTITL